MSKLFENRNGSSMIGKRILITGANGFIGSRFAKFLMQAQLIPIGLIRKSAKLDELEKLGILDRLLLLEMNDDFSNLSSLIQEARPDYIVHTASASRCKEDASGIREMVAANILFPSLLLDAMLSNDIKSIVNIGTSWQSCDGSKYLPFNYYAATKQSFEDVLDHYVSMGLSAKTVRFFDTYGPHDPRQKILNLIISHTLSGDCLDMSPGMQNIHLVHIEDICRALFFCVVNGLGGQEAKHEIFDLPSAEAISLRHLAVMIENITGKKCPINWGKRDYRTNEIMNPVISNPPIPGFLHSIFLRDGLIEVIDANIQEQNFKY